MTASAERLKEVEIFEADGSDEHVSEHVPIKDR